MEQAPAIITGVDPLFWADPHLGHENLRAKYRQEFATIEEHDDYLIQQQNDMAKAIGRRAFTYVLGDLSLTPMERRLKYLRRIEGNKALIEGNHDERTGNLPGWNFVKQTYELKIDGQWMFLCHFAMRTWNRQRKSAWNIHGHSHNQLTFDPRFLSQDVGVDVVHPDGSKYRPFTFDELREMFKNRPEPELNYAFARQPEGIAA